MPDYGFASGDQWDVGQGAYVSIPGRYMIIRIRPSRLQGRHRLTQLMGKVDLTPVVVVLPIG